jgi:Bacterial archaeo-eukaryotic release factor family 2
LPSAAGPDPGWHGLAKLALVRVRSNTRRTFKNWAYRRSRRSEPMKAGTLRPLYSAIGGYATVYLDTDRRTPDAPHVIELRWREARDELTTAGAHQETLDALGNVIADPDLLAPGRAVFARDGAVTGTIGLRTPPALPIAELSPLPRLLPALGDVPPAVPHLRVAVSRAGGEIVTYYGPELWAAPGARQQAGWLNRQESRRPSEASATSRPVHKTSAGGWSQARYQRSVDHRLAENARQFAARIVREADQAGARFIVVSGDARARGLLLGRLSASPVDRVVVLDADVPADDEKLAAVADATATRLATQDCRHALDRWRELSAMDLAAEGIKATVAAVRDGQAATVFLSDDSALAAIAWLGAGGTELATSQAELARRGVLGPLAERADEAIIRAAASTDADLFVIPDELAADYAPKDGVCAALRDPLPTPR